MALLRDLMVESVATVAPSAPLAMAEELMTGLRIRHLPVVDDGVLVGLLSFSDVQRASVSSLTKQPEGLEKRRKQLIEVRSVMTADPFVLGPDDAVADAVGWMVRDRLGCVPVVDEVYRLLGMVTITDVLNLARVMLERLPGDDAAAMASFAREQRANRATRATPAPASGRIDG
jgi:CBS domain-containing protein